MGGTQGTRVSYQVDYSRSSPETGGGGAKVTDMAQFPWELSQVMHYQVFDNLIIRLVITSISINQKFLE